MHAAHDPDIWPTALDVAADKRSLAVTMIDRATMLRVEFNAPSIADFILEAADIYEKLDRVGQSRL